MNNYLINSKSYWDYRYDTDWVQCGGDKQSEHFAKMIIDNLPISVYEDILNNRYSILDWGCGQGQLCYELSELFLNSNITGIDISDVAVEQAKILYPDLQFRSLSLQFNEKFDVIIVSNTLEHFEDPKIIMEQHLNSANKYYIILSPFQERYPLVLEHKYSFDDKDFPDIIGDFKLVCKVIISTSKSGFWSGNQILVIYQKI